MEIKEFLKKIRNNYMERTANAVIIPDDFKDEDQTIIRKQFLFSGRVQHVGFRMEMYLMAEKIDLTGWAKNLPDGRVEAEVQGRLDRINFLLNYLKSVKRFQITNFVEKEIVVQPEEKGFLPYY